MQVVGYIIDSKTSEPLAGATVRATDSTGTAVYNQVVANANGYYDIDAASDKYLLVSRVGYTSALISVMDADIVGVIVLEQGNSALPPVVVTPGSNMSLLILLAPVVAFAVSQWVNRKKKIGFAQAMVVSKLMSDPVWKWVIIAALIGVGIVVIKSINGILRFLGIKKKPETANLDKAAQDPTSFWNPKFWESGPTGTLLLTEATAQNYIQKIYDAIGWFNDDEEAIISVFKQLKTQSQASYLADKFAKKYNSDLLTFLRGTGYPPYDRLSDYEVNDITEYLEKLPKYKL